MQQTVRSPIEPRRCVCSNRGDIPPTRCTCKPTLSRTGWAPNLSIGGGEVSGSVQIQRVDGLLDLTGDLAGILVEGTAPGHDQITVTIRCSSRQLVRQVTVVEERFVVSLTREEARAFECFCGGRIEVHVIDDNGDEIAPIWEAELECHTRPGDDETTPEFPACVLDPNALLGCELPAASPGPQYTLFYDQLLPIEKVPLADPIEVAVASPRLGQLEVALSDLKLHMAALVHFEQRWFFKDYKVSDLASTIPLAPHESLRLALRKTQRKRLTQTTIDSVEELESRESSLVDRDILNVARSMSTTENWQVSGNGSFSIGGLGLGASGSYSKSVNQAVQSTNQRLRESTQKSASTLKALQKTEISELSEVTEDNLRSRLLVNPYFDRSLLIRVYDLVKTYCVETHFIRAVPALTIAVENLPIGRDFVVSYGDFLAETLLDTALALELGNALEAVNELRDETDVERAVEVAELALAYLFKSPPNMFNVGGLPVPGPVPDPNDPANSFNAQLLGSGLGDANDNNLGLVFTTLGYYYRIYTDRVSSQANPPAGTALDDRFAVDLAVSLANFLTPLWLGFENAGQISNVLDSNDQTEVLRRLSGFLSLVSGILTPLVAPVEEMRETEMKTRRAENVIRRTVHHLKANQWYYAKAFFDYLEKTRRHDLMVQFAIDCIETTTIQSPDQLLEQLDIDAVYVDGLTLVIPALSNASPQDFAPFSPMLADVPGTDVTEPGIISVMEVEVPCDGSYFDATSGRCVLENLPNRTVSVLEATGIEGTSPNALTIETTL